MNRESVIKTRPIKAAQTFSLSLFWKTQARALLAGTEVEHLWKKEERSQYLRTWLDHLHIVRGMVSICLRVKLQEESRCDWVSSQLTYKGSDLQSLPGWKKQPDLSCSVARPECSDNLKRFHPDRRQCVNYSLIVFFLFSVRTRIRLKCTCTARIVPFTFSRPTLTKC